jgi:hypothetical protein
MQQIFLALFLYFFMDSESFEIKRLQIHYN